MRRRKAVLHVVPDELVIHDYPARMFLVTVIAAGGHFEQGQYGSETQARRVAVELAQSGRHAWVFETVRATNYSPAGSR